MEIVLVGSGMLAGQCVRTLRERGFGVARVYETEGNPLSDLSSVCESLAIPCSTVTRDQLWKALVRHDQETVVLSVNNIYLFPAQVCEKRELRIVNFHGALLPRYRGRGESVIAWALFNGEDHHGATWHLVQAGVDTGPILCHHRFELSDRDTALDVMTRCLKHGHALFETHLPQLLDFDVRGTPQPPPDSPIYRLRDLPNDGLFDLEWDFMRASRFLRALDYGLFPVLPLPRLVTEGRTMLIAGYALKPLSPTIGRGGTMKRAPGGSKVVVEYPGASIVLNLSATDPR
ncbi:MAG: formyltransferase family protein [Kofleriaceae bacterium]|nr:formyltransferase family protein [Kofleriaceae bacterium]